MKTSLDVGVLSSLAHLAISDEAVSAVFSLILCFGSVTPMFSKALRELLFSLCFSCYVSPALLIANYSLRSIRKQ